MQTRNLTFYLVNINKYPECDFIERVRDERKM